MFKGRRFFAQRMSRLFIVTLCVLCNAVYAQQHVFNMSAFGINFGKMTVTKVKENDSTDLYTLDANGYLKVLWMERRDQTLYEVRYRNGKLLSSSYTQIETGKIKKWTKVHFDGEKYVVDSYRGKRSFREAPVYSVLTLYFDDPKNVERIFYEAESEFTSLKKLNDNAYELTGSDGNRSVYKFANGTIQEAEFHISIATVYMKRIK